MPAERATTPDDDGRSDDELMLAAGRGAREAFAEIVARHHRRILNLLTFLTGDEEMARDLTQECFLRALRAAPGWEPRAKPGTFLVAIARNLVVDARRAAWSRRETLDFEPASEAIAPDAAAQRTELRERLTAALASLAPEEREALVLSEVGGLGYRRIAEIAGVPEGTVASRKNRAARRLRERFGDWLREASR